MDTNTNNFKPNKDVWNDYWENKNELDKTDTEKYYASYTGRMMCKALRALIPETLKNYKAIDIGCGEGLYFKFLKNSGASIVVGADSSQKILDICKNNNTFSTTVCVDITKNIPFNDNTFDVLICLGLIEHMENPHKILNEFHRLLKPGGILILEMPNKMNIGTFLKLRQAERFKMNHLHWWGPKQFIDFIKRDTNFTYKEFCSVILFNKYMAVLYSSIFD
jgi:2-polyprenyl-3-methyl-5-hydroxy-6-metoxy-1,4-benzoquinol methylase